MEDTPLFSRSKRLFTAAAVVVATVVAGGVLHMASADVASGDRGIFVPVVPCRLFDTRAGENIGLRTTPLGAGDAIAQNVRGTNGLCTIPTDAVAVALNVTIVNPTADSYLTVWPSDAPQPLASNLNWRRGDPPTPNKVDVKLAADGRVSFFNFSGSVDILADVVGYYANHNHDDRYYTKAQEDAAFAVKANKPVGTTQVVVDSAAFRADIDVNFGFAHDFLDGYVTNINGGAPMCAAAPLVVPNGVSITSVIGDVYDGSAGQTVSLSLYRNPRGSASTTLMALVDTGAASATPFNVAITNSTISTPVVDSTQNGYFLAVCGLVAQTRLYDVTITYVNP